MKKEPELEKTPVTQPAPQLPNIPLSPDDPFQPNIEQQALITPDFDAPTIPSQPVARRPPPRERVADAASPQTL
ncbi:MAG: hypothetical protein HOP19_28075 [Acidobacteria bacterium]|nr:hypothetical protein [Acidobacteriota bacterium]